MALALARLCPGEVFVLDEVTVAGVRTQGKDHITREDARGTGSDLLFFTTTLLRRTQGPRRSTLIPSKVLVDFLKVSPAFTTLDSKPPTLVPLRDKSHPNHNIPQCSILFLGA
jgi:hypothetical protein